MTSRNSYVFGTCDKDYSSGGTVFVTYRASFLEAPPPETLMPSPTLGPNFPTLDWDIFHSTHTLNGVATYIPRYGVLFDQDEPGRSVEGDPAGDWLGFDYYETVITGVYDEKPDWLDSSGVISVGPEIESGDRTYWTPILVSATEAQQIAEGSRIRIACTDPEPIPDPDPAPDPDPGPAPDPAPDLDPPSEDDVIVDGVNLGSASPEFLETVTDPEVIEAYWDVHIVDWSDTMDRGFRYIQEGGRASEGISDRFAIGSPEYTVTDDGDLPVAALWESAPWEAAGGDEDMPGGSGIGLGALHDMVAGSIASGLMRLLKDQVRNALPGQELVDFFDSAEDAKGLYDTVTALHSKAFQVLDGFAPAVLAETPEERITSIVDMEAAWDDMRQEFADAVNAKVPLLGSLMFGLSFGSRHSDVSYSAAFDWLRLGQGDDHSNRVAFGEATDVRYFAGKGADVLLGGPGNDRLAGQGGHDRIAGGEGRDRLKGGVGKDTLTGGKGGDLLKGGGGRDILDGGKGRDILTGGAKADVFFFKKGSGKDVITDFQIGVDTVEIGKGAKRFGQLTFEEAGVDVVMTFRNVEVTFQDTLLEEVANRDYFVF